MLHVPCYMLDFLILTLALLITAYATWPPRGERRGWLIVGMTALWGAVVAVGWRRGVLAGYESWLVLLALIGAVLGLLVVWSFTNLLGRPRQ